MKNESSFNNTLKQVRTFATGLFVGSALGAGAALLNAPQSGRKTRRQIQKKAAEVQSRAEAKVEGVRERIQGAGRQLAETAEMAQVQVQEAADNRLGQLQEDFKV